MAIWNVDSLIGHLQLALAPALVGAFLALSNRGSASLISTSPPLAASEPRPLLQKILDICELPHKAVATNPLLASSTRRRGDANARMDNRRRGRDWPDLVGRRDVELGPRGGRLGFGPRYRGPLSNPPVADANCSTGRLLLYCTVMSAWPPLQGV